MQKPFHVIFIIILSLIVFILFAKSCQEDDVENIEHLSSFEQLADEDNLVDYHSSNDEDLFFFNKSEFDNNNWPDSIYIVIRNVDYLSDIEKEVIIEHNKCRTNPQRYANEVLQPYLRTLGTNGDNYKDQYGNDVLDDIKAVTKEAINELLNLSPLPMLSPKIYLYKAAKDHCKSQCETGKTGHKGIDGSSPYSRVKKHNNNISQIGENIAYGSRSGKDIVRDLIIDYGVSDRGHRKNILGNFRFIGCSFGFHNSNFNTMCVIDYEL